MHVKTYLLAREVEFLTQTLLTKQSLPVIVSQTAKAFARNGRNV